MKIVEDLSELREKLKDKKVVLCHGTFDICHPGHVLHLRQAKEQGDVLVVTITGDQHVSKRRKVFFHQDLRAEHLASLEMVDYVHILEEPTAISGLQSLRPNVFVKGKEYRDLVNEETREEAALMEECGGVIFFTDTDEFSSTKMAYLSGLMSEAQAQQPLAEVGHEFVDISPSPFEMSMLQEFLAKARELKVCVIGEQILDVYAYDYMGYSEGNKSLSGREKTRIIQVGGASIIGSHISDFIYHLERVDNGDMIPNEIVKTRYINADTDTVVYTHKEIDASPLTEVPDLRGFDVVIVADFGHGFINNSMAEEIVKEALEKNEVFLAVQCQTNNDNLGYNLVDKYPTAHYYNMNQIEAGLLLREQPKDLNVLVSALSDHLICRHFSVTMGEKGALLYDDQGWSTLPPLSNKVVDTIGCGDALFAFTSLALAVGMDRDVALFIGSLASALMAQVRGNDRFISAKDLKTVWKVVA
ncbi:MAG: adenylyltransferase/cytidyltransferase family protein [Nitrososphaeria archaeon]|nr:adenylyltransferase/cytidyltransferase family protein [Nitrososphaeria archaeon]NIQ34271.1 adenylyltransferase/cytidyltransferase family protein [Nitrososphaeria archaeon]